VYSWKNMLDTAKEVMTVLFDMRFCPNSC
jgi:hypothetical protein